MNWDVIRIFDQLDYQGNALVPDSRRPLDIKSGSTLVVDNKNNNIFDKP